MTELEQVKATLSRVQQELVAKDKMVQSLTLSLQDRDREIDRLSGLVRSQRIQENAVSEKIARLEMLEAKFTGITESVRDPMVFVHGSSSGRSRPGVNPFKTGNW
jgi:septal ring factor EnvC (AmiA/AmiB activator)